MDETRGRESPSPGIPLEGSRIFADLVLFLNQLLQDTRSAASRRQSGEAETKWA